MILPLENNKEIYEWVIWTPEENQERRISLQLDGIGDEVIRYGIAPVLDPIGELVIYPCEKCDGSEYMVKEVESGNNIWSIDLGIVPTVAYRGLPVWSPDGAYVAVTGGRSTKQNGLWIFDRNGEVVHNITLPDIDGVYAADALFWSPNSEILAFLRLSFDPQGNSKQTLAYLVINTGEVVDLCLNYQPNSAAWSLDSKMIAFIPSGDNEAQNSVGIVDLEGNVNFLPIDNVSEIHGWVLLYSQ